MSIMHTKDEIMPYKLTVGTFFYLVLQAKTSRALQRGPHSSGITESKCIIELIKIGNPKMNLFVGEDTKAQEISKIKNCNLNIPGWLGIDTDNYIDTFNERMEKEYDLVLAEMIEWSQEYLNLDVHGNWLVKSLLEILDEDQDIQDDELIYATRDGKKKSIAQIYKEESIGVQPFLLGVWHFIINRDIINKDGRGTIIRIGNKNVVKGAVRSVANDIGQSGKYEGKITILNRFQFEQAARSVVGRELNEYHQVVTRRMKEYPSELQYKGERLALSDDEFSEYLRKVYDAYKEVKTLLFRQEPRFFYDIYQPNALRVEQRTFFGMSRTGARIENPTAVKVAGRRRQVIVTGIGGLGKSMMLRHFLLDAIDHYREYRKVPIFVPLKDYNLEYTSLLDFIYEVFSSFDASRTKEDLTDLLASGNCLLLLDGIDEISSNCRKEFNKQIERLTNGYCESPIIMSSRPNDSFISYSRFANLSVCPFTKEESIKLIQKLDLGAQENKLKEEFLVELDKNLFDTHREFAEIPLLLTIMLMTYKNYNRIPIKIHKFYSKAFDTLFTEHDAIKVGGHIREYKTGLSQDRFAEYFDEFCFLSYQDENYDPTKEDCKHYFKNLVAVEEDNYSFTWKDFMDDVVDCVCLMYEEGQKYHFLHRSFQEYFCARYFCRQEDDMLWDIAMFFDDIRIRKGDKTFAMLYDMKSKAMEEKVFVKLLEEFYDGNPESNYVKFLCKMYPEILCVEGETTYPVFVESASYVYSFISRNILKIDAPEDLMVENWDTDSMAIEREFVCYDPEYRQEVDEEGNIHYSKGDNEDIYPRDEVSQEYIEHIEEPETVGYITSICTYKLFQKGDADEDSMCLIAELMDDEFPLKQEFYRVQEYYNSIKKKGIERKNNLHDKLRKRARG